MLYLAVALGGAMGATARYAVGGWVHSWAGQGFPWGTMTVNVAGSFLIGIVFLAGSERFLLSPEWRLFLTTGFCGGFTTFSTFSLETLALLQEQQWGAAAANAGLNLGLCVAAAALGAMAGRLL